jgi:hypothetical protein
MVYKASAIILFTFFLLSAFSQKVILNVAMDNRIAKPDNDTIYYSVNRPLAWNDFKGVPDNNNSGGAITASGFAFNANMNMVGNDVYLNVKVFTFFSKKNSWKKPNINSDYHLLHEQHHFDITRLSAERFCAELRKANFTVNSYQKLLSSIFNKAFNENSVLQNQYDRETHHSINTSEQLKWNSKIAEQVKSL